ncbi:monocarboxylate transporter 12-like [Paramacrobiotus metropolitanus]|uniref:monocarboxylate transporter 12-like n=1 Tax=Paramacrobiotus metropolitanus TaxID=2943436 RepID=UPI002446278F|nr:monocarboxylate transporter 12-like [Paramacrobiotus metropolitanus]
MMSTGRALQDVDRGWAWVVLFGGCLTQAIGDGLRQTSGILFSEFIDNLGLTRPQAAAVIAVFNGMFMIPAPLVSLVAHKVGLRVTTVAGAILCAAGYLGSSFCHSFWPLLITFGAMNGLGNCMVYIPTLATLPLWFNKYRQLTAAINMTCGALGIFILAPLLQALIDSYTWRGAVLVVAGIVLQGAPSGMTFFPAKLPETANQKMASVVSARNVLLKNLAYWLHVVHGFLIFGVPLFLIFIVRHVVKHRGFTPQEAAMLVSAVGISNFFGRFSAVAITMNRFTRGKNVRMAAFNASSLGAAVSILCIPLIGGFYETVVVCIVAGFLQGCKLGTMLGVTMDITTPALFQTGYGIFHGVAGISILIFPPFAGYLAERAGNYNACFYLSAVALFLSFLVGMAVHYLMYQKDKLRQTFEEGTAAAGDSPKEAETGKL